MLIALAAMFGQQSLASIGKTLPAVLAPLVIAELHADAAWVGVYYGLAAAAALIGQMGCGSLILRHGALRMSQWALLLLAGGMAAAAAGGIAGFAVSAVVAGGGGAVSTPTSSQLLGRVSPPRLAPLIFSIKQTAVPAGILLCGAIGPWFAAAIGWRGVILGAAAICLLGAVALQPLRARFDNDRTPSRRFRLADLAATILSVVKAPELRAMSFACFAFNGVQSVFTAYFVTYLAASGYELAAAGLLFSLVVVLAMPCRVLWGWLGSFFVAPHLVMAGLSFGMAAGMAFLGIIGPGWPTAALASAGAVVSATALSWHGILLSEAARLAPTGTIGSVTGGILSFGQIGALFGPILFSLLLGLTGGYAIGWAICAIPGLWVGFLMLRPAATKEQSVLLGK